jgi:hypothetical protein
MLAPLTLAMSAQRACPGAWSGPLQPARVTAVRRDFPVESHAVAAPPYRSSVAGPRVLGDAVLPGAGAIWPGQPVWSIGTVPSKVPACLLKAYPTYLTFGF